MCLNVRKELLRLVKSADGKPVGGKQPPDRFKDRWVIIDQANNLRGGFFTARHAHLRDRPIFKVGRVEQPAG